MTKLFGAKTFLEKQEKLMSKYFPYIFWCMLAIALVLSFIVADEIEDRLTSIEENLDIIENVLKDMPKE